MLRKILLACGIVATLLYIGGDIVASLRLPGYRYADQAVSELSAVGAPTAPFLRGVGLMYTLLVLAFGFGVWLAAGQKRALRITAALLLLNGLLGFVWPLFPMHERGAERTFTDTMHLVLTAVTVLGLLVSMGFGSAADGKRFRIYSIATIVAMIVSFGVSALYIPRVDANVATPGLGLIERVNVYGYMVWMAVLGIVLLRTAATGESARRLRFLRELRLH